MAAAARVRPYARYLVFVEYIGSRFSGSAPNSQARLPSVTAALDAAVRGAGATIASRDKATSSNLPPQARNRCTHTELQPLPSARCASASGSARGMFFAHAVHGSSRTDAGVHALANPFHIDTWRRGRDLPSWVDGTDPDRPAVPAHTFKGLLNHGLAGTAVRVVAAVEVPRTMHARHAATRRTYTYRIVANTGNVSSKNNTLFHRDTMWTVPQRLDMDTLCKNAKMFEGNHDFSTFRSAGCTAKSAVRTVDEVRVTCEPEPFPYTHRPSPEPCQCIHITVIARSFLYNQVRRMVG